MSELLPTLPAQGEIVEPEVARAIEARVVETVEQLASVDAAVEWLAQADALAAYLRDKDARDPMRGAQRRIETRIGQLLGKGTRGHATGHDPLRDDERVDFRLLARALDEGLLDYHDDGDETPWRASRRALVIAAKLRDLSGVKGSVTVEWYTPARYIEAAREVLGGIDLDPASSPLANETVKASSIYTERDDGLVLDWHGRVWLNPPYGKGTGLFTAKLDAEYTAGRVQAAILLINAYGFDSSWFQPLWDHLLCFTDHRIVFTSPQRGTGGPANANLFAYYGHDRNAFARVFSEFGAIVERVR